MIKQLEKIRKELVRVNHMCLDIEDEDLRIGLLNSTQKTVYSIDDGVRWCTLNSKEEI